MGFSRDELDAAAALLGLPDRVDPDVYLPSREVIRMETALIRSKWTQAEREARLNAAWSVRMKDATEHDNDVGGSTVNHRGDRGTSDGASR